jgi:hypothetical protein
MLLNIAPEVTTNIYSHLDIENMYRIREVSKDSKAIAERAIWDHIAQEEHVNLRLGEKDSKVSLKLYGHSYDDKNRVIEFRPREDIMLNLTDTLATSGDLMLRTFQLWFSGWKYHQLLDQSTESFQTAMKTMNRTENANMLFHETYNPAHEKLYLLPSVHDLGDPDRTRYVGDSEVVLALRYHADKVLTPYYSRTANGLASITALAPPPERSASIISLHVSISWILSGICQNVFPIEIYASYRQHLNRTLSEHHAFTYNPNCEQVLQWLMSKNAEKGVVPEDLIVFLKEHTHEALSRQTEVERMLESAGVDSSVLWKYGFAKRWLAGKGAFVTEDVVRRIQVMEERWQKERQSLMRRLAKVKASEGQL